MKKYGGRHPYATEGEVDLDRMAQRVTTLLKFKHFYDQIDFKPYQRLAITKSIIELIGPQVVATVLRIGRDEAPNSRMTRLCYTTTSSATTTLVHHCECERGRAWEGYAQPVILTEDRLFGSLGCNQHPTWKDKKTVDRGIDFRGHSTYTMVFVNLDLTMGSMRVAHKFHVIDSQTTYHQLLGRT